MASPLSDSSQIQGNILRPFRGDHQAFVFLSFRSDRPGARAWLTGAAGRTTGNDEVPQSRPAPDGTPARALLNVGLTGTGLTLLHPETAGDLAGHTAFWQGPLGTRLDDAGLLTTAPALLGDLGPGDPSQWVVGGPGRPVDALLTVAADEYDDLAVAVERELLEAERHALAILSVQWGGVLRNEHGKRIEHFGFADGISQPGVRGFADTQKSGAPVIAAGEFLLGHPGERRPPSWTPRPTPAAWMRNGSFQVFRRLRQDVAGWWEHMNALSAADGGSPEDAAARALGRHLDGRPLAAPDRVNDFTYHGDDDGARTPRYAHIRKVNPREDAVFRDRGHKMLRRGIPFGPRLHRHQPDNGEERGMLFNAYMASIDDQFEYVQRRWATDPGFPSSTLARYGRAGATDGPAVDGLDPVLGGNARQAGETLAPEVVRGIPAAAFGGFVTTSGAVYAFTPSLRALRQLAGDAPLDALATA
ncbi:Dyp-type peroxidase family protein [Actinoplanes sp. SE50]|uniref:Dyp-type peroxidase n=1 Tax=unclassified Actinoplanes TaxID=2626549 RepID=UPI00023EC09F|nr:MULTISPECIES: Dyp-type peroxidase [unclassified Actinoplanes]AEV83523.1 Dyp-type peroxidase family protein [Actinoplanes sp. SE50/110]ATO82333.1 Dyp-type peroxidase family protein [Actinoplanes sp. SE50]SLL99740.1 peroxidase [Actinoplanes sp. SE50/110]